MMRPVFILALASGLLASEVRPLPSWIKLTGDIRGRMEVYAGSEKVPGRTEWYYLNRVRLNTTIAPTEKLRFFVQAQDSRAIRTEGIAPPPNLVDPVDLRQFYLHYGSAEGKGWFVRAGRQPLTFGAARLVWMSEWGNVGPAFDGVRAGYGNEKYTLDWFGVNAVRPLVDGWDQPRWDRQIYGFFGRFNSLVPRTVVEPFVLWKHNQAAVCERGRPGHLDVRTVGFRATGNPVRRLDWIADLAFQSGHVAGDRASAWAGHWEAGVRPWDPERGIRLFGEYQRASGDKSPGDGSHGSFDQLYPAWKFGTADPIGWSNMQEGVAGLEWRAFRTWTFRAAYHEIWLLRLNDSLYSAGGAVLGCNPLASSKRIGGEFDLRATHTFGKHLSFMAGLGRFSAGQYWRETRRTRGTTYPFVMWMYSF